MASLSIARPGKVSERQYLGDLAGLFDRQRRRAGVALTPDSFASDLAANDALRSGLFTLCNAISHMGEHDLTAEELLGLVARALGGACSAEGETGAEVPAGMREAFLSGYEAWQNRDAMPIGSLGEPEVWPPAAPGARKPPERETATDLHAHELAAAASGTSGHAEPLMSVPGRRTVQEALSMVRHSRAGDRGEHVGDSASAAPGGGDVGSITLGQLKHMLEEIEGRVSRLGPHLSSGAREPSRRERPTPLPDTVIPFPVPRGQTANPRDDDPHGVDLDTEPFVRRRPIPAPNARAEDTFLAQGAETDERPRGIDALVAAAPAWASSIPTSRSFDEEAFLARHAYLAPARRPGSSAPASIYYAETPAAPLAPPPAALPQVPAITPVTVAPVSIAPSTPPPLIGLDAEDDPLLSPAERLQAYMLRLSPRKVFLTLASLTILAGGLAGFIAYKTMHYGRPPQFKDLEQTARFGAPASQQAAAPAPAVNGIPSSQATSSTQPVNAATSALPAATAPRSNAPRTPPPAPKWKPHSVPAHTPAVAVWPPVPQQIARDATPVAPAPANAQQAANPATPQSPASGLFYVPAPTMIGYALATPQPAYPAAQAHGISGTVAVEVTVSRLGDVTLAHAVSGPPELRAAAVAAVRGWRFRPYVVNGKPVEVSTTLQFFFKGE